MEGKNNSLEKILLELNSKLRESNLTSKGNEFYSEVQNVLETPEDYFTNKNTENPPNEQLKTMYFSMPEQNGIFKKEWGNSENDGRKYYKIEFSKNLNKGKISYISQGRDRRAMNRYEAYLKPVCEMENYEEMENSNNILQLEHGEVIVNEDEFVISKKIKIKCI